MTLTSGDEAQSAYDNAASLPVAGSCFEAEFLRSCNIFDRDIEYVPSLFEDSLVDPTLHVRQVKHPRWFLHSAGMGAETLSRLPGTVGNT